MQWNRFRQSQLDSHSGHPVSAERFWSATGWRAADLAGKWVLDAGCGAGRFAEVALGAGANVLALDYSSAVDACYANLKHHAGLHVVQADIYALPLAAGFFPYVYSLGVLQHTPDVARAFAALPPFLAEDGRICVDLYERSWRSALQPKYWLRPFTKRMPPQKLFGALESLVPRLLPVSRVAGRVPVVGPALKRLVPVADPPAAHALDDKARAEWALLDTFDWLAPQHDHPQSAPTLARWLADAGLSQIEVLRAGHLVGRGRRPHAPRH
jgi:SAM-dependent methyltransferase